jgi:diphosphomevalonate decarboxylase
MIRAYVNFALIKYWGKLDEDLRLPYQSSLSFTVDNLYTDTEITILSDAKKDIVIINGVENPKESMRVINYLNRLRKELNVSSYVKVISTNNVPMAAGLASSASSFASIATAFVKAFKFDISKEEISRLARLGSGSASRSIYGGFAVWEKGTDKTSVAKKLDVKWDEFRIIVCLLDKNEKKISSTFAMEKSVKNKELYNKFVVESEKDYNNMLNALNNKDINAVGTIAEENSERMHEIIEASGIKYKNEQSNYLINLVKKMRSDKIIAYFTMDAGPNVKIITIESEVKKILSYLSNVETIVCKQGFDAKEVKH